MGQTWYKIGFIAEIMRLRHKTEHEMYEYFMKLGIDPDSYYTEDNPYSDLYYEISMNGPTPVILHDGALVMYVIAHGAIDGDYDLDCIMNSIEVQGLREKLHAKFRVRGSKFFAYTWNSSTDEPCYVDDKYRGE